MAHRRTTHIPALLMVTLLALLATPVAMFAASGLPATLTMTPDVAGPGQQVEVTGLDFPANAAVDLQLTSVAGAVSLGTAQTAEGGFFRQTLTLPADAAAGYWELRATGADGSVAVHLFEATAASSAIGAAEVGQGTVVEALSAGGNSSGDIVVLLVFAVIIAAVGGAAAYVYFQLKHGNEQPGMSSGEDPIWGGLAPAGEPQVVEEASLRTAHSES